jgi:hypothetical protein
VVLLGSRLGAATTHAACSQLPSMRSLSEAAAGGGRALVSGCTSSVLQLWHYHPELHLHLHTPGQAAQGEAQSEGQGQELGAAVAQYMQEAMQQLSTVAGVNNTEVNLVLLGAMPRPEAGGGAAGTEAAQQPGAGLLSLEELSQYMAQLSGAARVAERAFPQVGARQGRPHCWLSMLPAAHAHTVAARAEGPGCWRLTLRLLVSPACSSPLRTLIHTQALVMLHTLARAIHHDGHSHEGSQQAGEQGQHTLGRQQAARLAQLSGAVRQVARLQQLSYIDYEAMSVGYPGPEGAGAGAGADSGSGSGGGSAGGDGRRALPLQGLNLLLAQYDRYWRCGQLPVIDEAAMLQVLR